MKRVGLALDVRSYTAGFEKRIAVVIRVQNSPLSRSYRSSPMKPLSVNRFRTPAVAFPAGAYMLAFL
jgi:hypothetical protein